MRFSSEGPKGRRKLARLQTGHRMHMPLVAAQNAEAGKRDMVSHRLLLGRDVCSNSGVPRRFRKYQWSSLYQCPCKDPVSSVLDSRKT
ncbi:hypothetical protein BST61_g9094 [Cercospora zeina]